MKKTAVIETNYGKIQGYIEKNIEIFKGISYAASPVDSLRFMAPEPPEYISGVFEALEFGPTVPQADSYFTQKPAPPQSETGCLTLNIWTPSCDDKKRPVLFWIHGGGFVTGAGSRPVMNGIHLANRGDVVVITINYRLGMFGNLYAPGITTNAGFLDMIEALKWVNHNIASFGGDPNNVTIFGESAGSVAVIALMAMPTAKGLINRVIAQSGTISTLLLRNGGEGGKKVFKRLKSLLNIEARNDKEAIKQLQQIPVDKILNAQNTIGLEKIPYSFPPFIDSENLPVHPIDWIREGSAKDIDLLIGTNLNETTLFNRLFTNKYENTEEEMYEIVYNISINYGLEKEKINQIINVYKQNRSKPADIADAFSTDTIFRVLSINTAEAQSFHQNNTYMYLFTYKSPFSDGKLGTPHAMEIPFVFGTLDEFRLEFYPESNPETTSLSEKIMDCWISFARTGNPNHDGIPNWPRYDKNTRMTMILDKTVKIENDPDGKERAAWDNIY